MHDCQCGTAELLLRLPVTWHDERSDGASAMQLDRSTSERINRTLLQRPAADKGSKLRAQAAPRTSTRTHQATDSASRKSPLHAGAWTKSPTRSEATCRRFAGMTFERRQTSTTARIVVPSALRITPCFKSKGTSRVLRSPSPKRLATCLVTGKITAPADLGPCSSCGK